MQNVCYSCCILTVDFVAAWRGRHSRQLVCAQNEDEEKDTSPIVANKACLQ